MGKRGPAPKPTNLRLLHGDRKDRINNAEPTPRDGVAEPPPTLSPAARDVWDYTAAELTSMRLLTPADRDALAVYCEAVVVHRRAAALVSASDVLLKGLHGGPVRNPALQVLRDAAGQVRAFAQEFGLTPSARSTISLGEKPRDEKERLLS